MTPLNLFDLHCDTATELYMQNQPLASNRLHVSLDKVAAFDTYIQTMAIWSDCRLPDEEAWLRFLQVETRLSEEIVRNGIPRLMSQGDMETALAAGRRGVILAVEDARILNGHIDRLELLHAFGVRFLTLTWAGETCIGGSHDTDAPLTPFGRKVVKRCFEIGIVPDVSHASRRVTAEVLDMAADAYRPVIATHSNACSVHRHTRNLTDDEFRQIASSGGVVGISLAPQHLTDGHCGIGDVVAHIRHYLSLGGEEHLCLGCDFDGIETTPDGLSDLSCLPALAEALSDAGLSDTAIRKIFFENAYGFAAANI